MEKASRSGQKNGQTWRSPDMVQKVFGICEAKNGTETDELYKSVRMVGSWQRRRGIEGQKKREELQEMSIRAPKQVLKGRFHGPRRIMESRWRKYAAG